MKTYPFTLWCISVMNDRLKCYTDFWWDRELWYHISEIEYDYRKSRLLCDKHNALWIWKYETITFSPHRKTWDLINNYKVT